MSGFMMGEAFGEMFGGMFAEQAKGVLLHVVAIRINRNVGINRIPADVLNEVFLEGNPEVEFTFTDKGEFKVWNKPKRRNPISVFPFCGVAWNKKDWLMCLTIRDGAGVPILQNISLLRNLLAKFRAEKVEYEIWQ